MFTADMTLKLCLSGSIAEPFGAYKYNCPSFNCLVTLDIWFGIQIFKNYVCDQVVYCLSDYEYISIKHSHICHYGDSLTMECMT